MSTDELTDATDDIGSLVKEVTNRGSPREAVEATHVPHVLADAILQQFETTVRYSYDLTGPRRAAITVTAHQITHPDADQTVVLVREYDGHREPTRFTHILPLARADEFLLRWLARVRQQAATLTLTALSVDTTAGLFTLAGSGTESAVRQLLATVAEPGVYPFPFNGPSETDRDGQQAVEEE